MIRVGLTGGIGSGKSVVAMIFSHLGIPVYHADYEAKKLYSDPEVMNEVIALFGNSVADESRLLNRSKLASIVFADPEKLGLLNSIIHPHIEAGFRTWMEEHQHFHYIIHEAAILFESGFNRFFDKTIVVTAPLELCIERVMKRDGMTRNQVEQRMKSQWDTERKAMLADFVLINDEREMLLPQVLTLHRKLMGI